MSRYLSMCLFSMIINLAVPKIYLRWIVLHQTKNCLLIFFWQEKIFGNFYYYYIRKIVKKKRLKHPHVVSEWKKKKNRKKKFLKKNFFFEKNLKIFWKKIFDFFGKMFVFWNSSDSKKFSRCHTHILNPPKDALRSPLSIPRN